MSPAVARAPSALRHLLGRSSFQRPLAAAAATTTAPRCAAPPFQRRWAQVHDVRFLATTQPKRNITEKYREKLEGKARQEGHANVDSLKEAYSERIQEIKKKDADTVPGLEKILEADLDAEGNEKHPSSHPQKQASTNPEEEEEDTSGIASPKTKSTGQGKAHGSVQPLSDIINLEHARPLTLPELSSVWRAGHSKLPNSLCAVLPSATYLELTATARRFPAFVLPVPRGADVGAELHFLQWVFDRASSTATVLFTQLAEYKARGEFAQPHTSVTHYWDAPLADPSSASGGSVLMAGAVVENRGATVQDAQWLVMLMQKFYGGEGASEAAAAAQGLGGSIPPAAAANPSDARAKKALLEQFGRGDPDFSVQKLLEESEKLG